MILPRSISFSLVLLSLFSGLLQAQSLAVLKEAEEKLSQLFDSISESADDEERIRKGEHFSEMLEQTLKLDGSFTYPLSLLPTLSKLTPPDQRFRILTWNIPLHSGTNRFYGCIQFQPQKGDPGTIIRLVDRGDAVRVPEDSVLCPGRWFGALYYELIPQQTEDGVRLYTLLGWRGGFLQMTIRVIDIMTVTTDGQVRFGKPVFCHYGETRPTRILFRHASGVTMTLRYDEQWVVTDKQWNARRKEFTTRREKTPMIVCDRLLPADPQLEGQYEYYLPAGDVLDGFIFKKGCWNFMEQIDVRNPVKK
ncbi:MAG: hypothetical protein D4R67_08360 [Bacteroidetes bacterium]|nr:MAG: hypothetical protein D4R67_08360 [Bacteroidota bacterium]